MKQKIINVQNKNLEKELKEISFKKPKFLYNEEDLRITSAEKGTLMHLCMQKLNPKIEYDMSQIKELINNLVLKDIITEKEAQEINSTKILEFTKTSIWKSLKNAKEIYREKPFYINIPAKNIYDEDVDDVVLVQGIIDLYFIDENNKLILIDYKTDFIENGDEKELVKKYSNQLELYRDALESALKRKVDKTYIYSVCLNKPILV